jgi:hypothetical protein
MERKKDSNEYENNVSRKQNRKEEKFKKRRKN